MGLFNSMYLKPTKKRNRKNIISSNKKNIANSENKASTEFRNSLFDCRMAAQEGLRVALEQKQDIRALVSGIIESNRKLNFTSNVAKVPQEYQNYKKGLITTQHALNQIYEVIDYKLNQYQNKLSEFTITVYGKTMVGKSTLMEVLIHGDGSSIGKGAQRTTKDVREYLWKETGVKFVDVPGIGAALEGGEKDTAIAFEAAKYSDLILFLITDDGPQKEEAEAFAKVKALGKPMICILNIKAGGISKAISMKLRVRNVKKRMAQLEDIQNIKAQFYQYAVEFGQDWNDIPFLYTDLHTAWLSQRLNDDDERNLLYDLSRFNDVTNTISSQITKQGSFYQFKTPIDIVYNGLQHVADELLNQYKSSAEVLHELDKQIQKLQKVTEEYNRASISKMEKTLQFIGNDLDNAAKRFADQHYGDENAAKNWEATVKKLDVDGKIMNVLREVQNDKERQLEQFALHIPDDLKVSFNITNANIQGDNPVDTKFLAKEASALLTAGLAFVPGIGWIAGTAIAIGSLVLGDVLTDSEKTKIQRRKEKMYESLSGWIHGSSKGGNRSKSFMQQLSDIMHNNYAEIFKLFEKTREAMEGYFDNVADIHVLQLQYWQRINTILSNINQRCLQKALIHLGHSSQIAIIQNSARIHGRADLLVFQSEKSMNKEILEHLEALVQEHIFTMQEKQIVYSGDDLIQSIKAIGGFSDEEIGAFNNTNVQMEFIQNKVQEKILILKENHKFVSEKLKQRANVIYDISTLMSRLYNYPVYVYPDKT